MFASGVGWLWQGPELPAGLICGLSGGWDVRDFVCQWEWPNGYQEIGKWWLTTGFWTYFQTNPYDIFCGLNGWSVGNRIWSPWIDSDPVGTWNILQNRVGPDRWMKFGCPVKRRINPKLLPFYVVGKINAFCLDQHWNLVFHFIFSWPKTVVFFHGFFRMIHWGFDYRLAMAIPDMFIKCLGLWAANLNHQEPQWQCSLSW